MKNKILSAAAAILILIVAGYFYKIYRIPPAIKFESLALTDLDGRALSLKSFKGQKLFLNFFATWCRPCLQELPSLQKAQQILAKEDFQFILISDEPISQLKYFKEQTGESLLILHSEIKLREEKILTLPTSYLLNSAMEIVFKKTGQDDWASEAMIKKFRETAAE